MGLLTTQLASKQDAAAAARLLVLLSGKPANADPLKEAALRQLARELKPDTVPAWSPELRQAFQALLTC